MQFSQSAPSARTGITPCQVPDAPSVVKYLSCFWRFVHIIIQGDDRVRRGTFQSSSVNLTLIDLPPFGRYGFDSAQSAAVAVVKGWSTKISVHE